MDEEENTKLIEQRREERKAALEKEVPRVMRSSECELYPAEAFYTFDSKYLKDLRENYDRYVDEIDPLLREVTLPSFLDGEYFKYESKSIDQREKREREGLRRRRSQLTELNPRRGSAKFYELRHSDDKCVICQVGDYEENNLIVFCDRCSVAVHQRCYGIERLPEGEWVCLNCAVFGK